MMTSRIHAQTVPLVILTAVTSAATLAIVQKLRRRYVRSKYINQTIEKEKRDEEEQETLPSIIADFSSMQLDYGSTVSEANKRRTVTYYERARDAHLYDLCPGTRNYFHLRNRREIEVQRILKYYTQGDKSHRTIIVMCDTDTQDVLAQARDDILEPLKYSTDAATPGVWISAMSVLPVRDIHVTVAIPWWWHTVRDQNHELSVELAARFRRALVQEFHHAFQIELERIVLLGGKALVALWRCIGERRNTDGSVIYDRHGNGPDPFVKLRRDIVSCFTSDEYNREPLTYTHRYSGITNNGAGVTPPAMSRQEGTLDEEEEDLPDPTEEPNERANTIELKTPGLGDHDGFIHTTLARLPLDCLSMTDVELGPIHRMCREATATYAGHRMVVSKFRFIETTGAGGDSNPCVSPLFDETIDAPARFEVNIEGVVSESNDLHVSKNVERSATIGALPKIARKMSLDDLFDEPLNQYA